MSFEETKSPADVYEGDFNQLNTKIEECFLKEPGPGIIPNNRDNDTKTEGFIVPCDDYSLSGYCAAWAYKRIAETAFKDIYIIIGHSSDGRSGILMEDFDTPLGITKTDSYFVRDIIDLTNISNTKELFYQNNSIKMQIPFLQYATKDKLNLLKIVCLSIGKDIDFNQIRVLSEAIKSTLGKTGKTATYICSSNLVHFGEKYKYTPFLYNIKESVENIDYHAIELIKKKNSKNLIEFVEKEQTTIFGYKAISLFIELIEGKESKMLEYYQSDIFNTAEHKKQSSDAKKEDFVSYVSFEF